MRAPEPRSPSGSTRWGISVWTFAALTSEDEIHEEGLYTSLVSYDALRRRQFDRGIRDAVKKLLHYTLVLIGFLLAAGAAGFQLQNFMVLAGAFGIGIGFGLQDIVNNFISGIILLFERPIKVGDGILGIVKPSLGAYAQIFPRQMEAVGFDVSQLGTFHWAVVTAGTLAEFLLPLLILIGLFTRLAALGMIGFTVVQSLTDIFGHGADEATIGGWFDRASDALIFDQRAFWVLLLLILVIRGAGPLSVDRLLARQAVSG